MATEIRTLRHHAPATAMADSAWKSLYKLGGVSALVAVVVALLEILITFLPGGEQTSSGSVTVLDWFTLFQTSWFLGLRNLGLINMILLALMIPTFLALYAVHRRVNQAYAALALIVYLVGIAVYIANNTAFAMLSLSNHYAAATTDAQRALLLAAGEALLAQGQSHTPGTFTGFFLMEVASILISLVMLRSKIFSKAAAYTGLLGFGLLFVFDICSSFVPALFDVAMLFAIGGGLLSMAWYILIGRRLLQLGQGILTEVVHQN